jgi:hypothetical protein
MRATFAVTPQASAGSLLIGLAITGFEGGIDVIGQMYHSAHRNLLGNHPA